MLLTGSFVLKIILFLLFVLHGHPVSEPFTKEVATIEECTEAVKDILNKVAADPKPGLLVQAGCVIPPVPVS